MVEVVTGHVTNFKNLDYETIAFVCYFFSPTGTTGKF